MALCYAPLAVGASAKPPPSVHGDTPLMRSPQNPSTAGRARWGAQAADRGRQCARTWPPEHTQTRNHGALIRILQLRPLTAAAPWTKTNLEFGASGDEEAAAPPSPPGRNDWGEGRRASWQNLQITNKLNIIFRLIGHYLFKGSVCP